MLLLQRIGLITLCTAWCMLQRDFAFSQSSGLADKRTSVTFPESKYYGLVQKDTQEIINQINYASMLMYRDIDSAIYLLHDVLDKSRYLSFDMGISAAYGNLSFCSNRLGDYQASIEYYRLGLPYISGFHDVVKEAMYYSCMSAPYFYTGQYDSMSYYVYKAEEMIRDLKPADVSSAKDMAGIYNNIGMLWVRSGDYGRARVYVGKAKKILMPYVQDSFAQIFISITDGNLATIYFQQREQDSAAYFYKLALQSHPENTNALLGLSDLYAAGNREEEAISLLQKAIHITAGSGNYIENMKARFQLGLMYYNRQDYDKAEPIFLFVIKKNKEISALILEDVFNLYLAFAQIKKAKGEDKEAFAYQQASLELSDSLAKQAGQKAVYDMELKSRTAQKDKEIVQKQLLLGRKESQLKTKNVWIGTISAIAVLVAALLTVLYRNSKNSQRLQAEKLNAMQQSQEISHLKAIIQGEEKERSRMARELHDGIMVQLSTVKMNLKTVPDPYRNTTSHDYFHTPYYQQMIRQLEDATRELRQTAHNLMPDMLLANGLPEAVYYFCKTVQQSTPLEIIFQQNGDIPRFQSEFELSVYRITQELVQNVIKHAHATRVIVQLFHTDENLLAVTVEDDGQGFDTSNLQGDGMGLKSIGTRVAVLGGTIDISSEYNNGTTVYLEFDIDKSGAAKPDIS